MTPRLALVLPYYRNPGMLAEQYRVWAAYPDQVKAQVEIIVVDDGSPEPALAVPRPAGLPAFRLYRVLTDLPWHQHGARNLGAREADAAWLLLTDIDHVVPAGTLEALLELLPVAEPDTVYTFGRRDAPDLRPTVNDRGQLKPHPNTFAMTKDWFWRVGGYDEDCVGYGTDAYFRARLKAASSGRLRHLAPLFVIRYPREVIPDANSSPPGVDPKAFRNAGRRSAETQRRLAHKRKRGYAPKVLDFPWERVL